ncbi:MAG: P-loop NTPase [Nitrososphaerales archaeon]|nr:P-loop NTPase [Nitrososphaerales archaeon]
MKIAVSGKGGVGKTTVAGTMARTLARKGYKVLAIDADPSPNLARTLGVTQDEASRVIPIAENEELIEEKTMIPQAAHGVHPEAYARVSFTVDDIVDRFAVKAPDGVSLLVMGQVEHAGEGCMCGPHRVTRELTEHLMVERDELVVMDMEAGIEHLSRGTARFMDAMLIVAEPYVKALETAARVDSLATELGIKDRYVVANKIRNPLDKKRVEDFCTKSRLELLAAIPYDERVEEADRQGKAPLDYAANSNAPTAIAELGARLTK